MSFFLFVCFVLDNFYDKYGLMKIYFSDLIKTIILIPEIFECITSFLTGQSMSSVSQTLMCTRFT